MEGAYVVFLVSKLATFNDPTRESQESASSLILSHSPTFRHPEIPENFQAFICVQAQFFHPDGYPSKRAQKYEINFQYAQEMLIVTQKTRKSHKEMKMVSRNQVLEGCECHAMGT